MTDLPSEDAKNLRWIAAILNNVGHGGAAITACNIADRISSVPATPAPTNNAALVEAMLRESIVRHPRAEAAIRELGRGILPALSSRAAAQKAKGIWDEVRGRFYSSMAAIVYVARRVLP